MDLTWLDPDHLDPRDVAEAVGVLEAARQVDTPHEPSQTVALFIADLRHGWDGTPSLVGVARNARGRVTGVLEIQLPAWDNTHLGTVWPTVDPAARRRGLGTALFEAGLDRIRAEGRSLVLAFAHDQPATTGFAKAMGLDRASEEVQRRQDVRGLDWERLDREYAAAAERATDYELVRVSGPTPEEMLPDVARMTAAINDAPIDDLAVEDEVFTPERIRAFDAARAAHGRRAYRLIARHRDTGELVGHTMVGVDGERPWLGSQYDTSVLRAHRGHRLGLFLKIGMLRWLAAEEPQLHTIDTWNAASNDHMIAVNELLGYRVIARSTAWQKRL
ncbi:MAG TPA: GNAT family N-acetyltransferase [Micromonosporaceae bacterium]